MESDQNLAIIFRDGAYTQTTHTIPRRILLCTLPPSQKKTRGRICMTCTCIGCLAKRIYHPAS